jgi:hypothetical protein
MFDWSTLMTPQKATLDSLRTLSHFHDSHSIDVSHLSFNFSLSAPALGLYLCARHSIEEYSNQPINGMLNSLSPSYISLW